MAHQHNIHCIQTRGPELYCSVTGQITSDTPRSQSRLTSSLRKWNEALHRITYNRYDPHVPLDELYRAATDAGFRLKSEEDTPFALLGHDGKAHVEYVHPDSPRKTYYLHISWHRMGSGHFETVAYAN